MSADQYPEVSGDDSGLVPPHCLLTLKDGTLAYIVRRFDRHGGKKIHQEDFYQILEKKDKYSGSLEQIGNKLREISAVPGLDVQLFFEQVLLSFVRIRFTPKHTTGCMLQTAVGLPEALALGVFGVKRIGTLSFILGNGDGHLKNYSISYHQDGVRLSPAYDIVCSKLVIPNEEDSALMINGRKNNLTHNDFDILAEVLKIPQKIRYDKFVGKAALVKQFIQESQLPKDFKTKFIQIVCSRYERLKIPA